MTKRTTTRKSSRKRAGTSEDVSLTTRGQRDARDVRIAIQLQEAAVLLKAAEVEIKKIAYEQHNPQAGRDVDMLNTVGRNLRVIHNRYSPVKMP